MGKRESKSSDQEGRLLILRPATSLRLAEDPIILTIDIGTTSIRTNLFDRLGRLIIGRGARTDTILYRSVEGAAEADADLLLELVFRCLDETMTKSKKAASRIKAVACCTLVNNILGIDKNNRALTRLTTYADTRAEEEVPGLRRDWEEDLIHDRTGCPFHSSYLPARLRWLYRNFPTLCRRVKRWISIGEYLELKLFGETSVSYSVASWTGLLNRRELNWDELLLAKLPIGVEQLSPLTDINVPRSGLRPSFAARWPALKDLPWFPAVGDGVVANIGCGCVSPARLALTVGTTSALRTILNGPLENLPAGLWNYRVDKKRTLFGGALSEGGNIYSWVQEVFNLKKSPHLNKELPHLEPDAHGLTILPFLAGERAPGWAGQAKATIHGLTLATKPMHILQAALEAVAYRLALVWEMICSKLPSPTQIVASGGAFLYLPAWLKIIADVFGKPLLLSSVQESAGRGAALLAMESLGVISDLANLPDFAGQIIRPDLKHHALYQKAKERQESLYKKLVKPASPKISFG